MIDFFADKTTLRK